MFNIMIVFLDSTHILEIELRRVEGIVALILHISNYELNSCLIQKLTQSEHTPCAIVTGLTVNVNQSRSQILDSSEHKGVSISACQRV